MLTTPGIDDIREHRNEIARMVAEAVKTGTDDRDWTDYVILDGEAVKGARKFEIEDKAVMRHHLKLTKEQLDGLGVPRVGPRARTGRVFVNGQEVVELAGEHLYHGQRREGPHLHGADDGHADPARSTRSRRSIAAAAPPAGPSRMWRMRWRRGKRRGIEVAGTPAFTGFPKTAAGRTGGVCRRDR